MKKKDLWCQYSDLPSPSFYNSDMKKEDIKIGNYLYYEHTTHIVTGIVGNKIYSWWVKDGKPVIEYEQKDVSGTQVENPYIDVISQYEPIQLEDEWFIQWGFTKDGEYWCKSINDYRYCFRWRDWANNWAFSIEYTDSPYKEDEEMKYPVSFDIQYVHQLQNLWSTLQHQELTIKI